MPIDRIFRTISFRLAALYAIIFALCFAALLLAVYVTTTSALRGQIRKEIQSELAILVEEANTDGIETIIQDIQERTTQNDGKQGYYFISDATGQKRVGNLDGVSLVDGPQEIAISQGETDDDHVVWAEGKRLADGSFLLVGQDAFWLLSVQETIINAFAWSGAVALLLAGFAGFLTSRGFLRRIDDINTTSRAIMDGKLKARIPLRGTSDEIDRLSANLNQLFDNNQSLLESLKQISANVAHDLRTPLSRLRQGLEEARMNATKGRVPVAALDGAIAESDQLLATFAALLRIAQIESGSRKAGFNDTNVSKVFERVYEAYVAVAEDEGKSLQADITPNLTMRADADLLLQMLANLIENAIRHTPEGTSITISLRKQNDRIVASLADTGPGIPEELHKKVFEHFYRADTARTTSGNGLGLSLVATIAKLHDIHIELQDNKPGLCVLLTFPLAET